VKWTWHVQIIFLEVDKNKNKTKTKTKTKTKQKQKQKQKQKHCQQIGNMKQDWAARDPDCNIVQTYMNKNNSQKIYVE